MAASLLDGNRLRRLLDESASQVVLEEGYNEYHAFTDVKILLGYVAIGFALYAQFVAVDLLESWWMILGCVVAYGFCQAGLTFVTTRLEKQACICTKKPAHVALMSGIRVSSSRAAYGEYYTLKIESMDTKKKCVPVEFKKRMNRWFYDDGDLAEDKFKADVRDLIKEYEAKNKGNKKNKKG